MAKRLTAAMLEKLAPPKSGRLEVADSVSPGLVLRVTPSGTMTYQLRGRVKGQRTPIRLTIGDARRMELKDARTAADELREKLLAGKDPRQEERSEWSEVVVDFIEKYAKRKNRSWRQTETLLTGKVSPHWTGKLVSQITADDVTALLNRVEDDVSIYMANRVLAAVRKLFNWARMRGLVKVSPVAPGLARAGEVQRDRVLSFDEIAAVWRAAESLGAPFGPLVQLLLLTGQRRGETAAARWTGMDLEGEHVWRLTTEETKGKRDHPVPLVPAALEIVKAQPLIADPEAAAEAARGGKDAPPPVYVFTTTGKTPLSGFSHAKRDLDAELVMAGQKLSPWRFHDLRRSVATHMEGALGVPFYIVGAVLNHAPAGYKGITSRYTQDDLLFERRQALTGWARLVALIVAGGKTWAKVEAILKPKDEADRVQLAELRRLIQGDTAAWTQYVEGLTRETSSNVTDLSRARGAA